MQHASVQAGPFTVRGHSLAGVYTALHVPELSALFDVGMPIRSAAGVDRLFLSHAHADHVGALVSLLGIRGMMQKGPPEVFMPAAVVSDLSDALTAMSRLQRYELEIVPRGMNPGDVVQLKNDLWVRAFLTHHSVPSLGYQLFRRVDKLKPEFASLPGAEIGRRRKAGDALFDQIERLEFAYATDTLVQVLDNNPSLYQSRVLVIECSFLDDRKPIELARAGCHIHLDELLERASLFENEHLVFMHTSQLYSPRAAREILEQRCPANIKQRLIPFLPNGPWPY